MNPGLALPGPHRREAMAIFAYCKNAGVSWKRAYALACAASYGQICWTFQTTLAEFTGYCVRTIQRAMRQAKALGLLVSRRLRRGEQPIGARQPITCGGALRRFIGWGKPDRHAEPLRAKYALKEIWRREALERRAERERAGIAVAIADFRALAPP